MTVRVIDVQTGIETTREFTEAEKAANAQIQAEAQVNVYIRQRENAYPPLGEQFDLLWHLIDAGGTLDKQSEFYRVLKSVKKKYPKGAS